VVVQIVFDAGDRATTRNLRFFCLGGHGRASTRSTHISPTRATTSDEHAAAAPARRDCAGAELERDQRARAVGDAARAAARSVPSIRGCAVSLHGLT